MNILEIKNLMVSTFQEVMEASKRAAALNRVKSEFFITFKNFKDIPIYTSNDLIYGHTGIKDTANALVTMADGKPTIFINEHFKNLPETTQYSLYCHEYAHIVLNHLETIDTRDHLETECEADAYAQFELGADVLGTLTSMYQSGEYTNPIVQEELSARIHSLTALVLAEESSNFKEA